ncbi:hypothetical protein JOQ06_014093 [Pogonophryne albipinna]|uniref:Uncharacterized protein n=1 Tax=Pogonophryne albipinna TaxID=1090488 RepID=A0AAD6F6L1_9TELE|nr:hypothetical protein JOQ06_014093 [Pogonophryne albipinna]
MSNPPATKACDIFTRGRSRSIKTAPPSPRSDSEDSNMANIADVLSELKSLRADLGTKLDNIDTCLTVVATSMAALEIKVTELKWDVSSNSTRINEAEGRIHYAEKTLEKTEAALDSVNTRIAYLESKTDDLENRGRRKTLRLDLSAETVRIRRGFNTVTKLFVDINAFRGFQRFQHNPCKLRVLHNGKMNLFTTPPEAEKFYKSIQQ